MIGLLHDDGDSIVAMTRKGSIVVNSLFNSFASIMTYARSRNASKHDVYIKHGQLLDITARNPTNKLDCRRSNFYGSRTFMLDLDAGPGKSYSVKEKIGSEIQKLTKTKQLLPPSLMLDTGHGYHVLWCLDEVILADEWHILKELFYRNVQAIGLLPDVSAGELERGTRLCGGGMLNHKDGTPTRIILQSQRISASMFRTRYNPSGLTSIPGTRTGQNVLTGSQPDDEWAINTEYVWTPQDSVNDCLIMADAHDTGGLTADHNLWADLIAVTARSSDEALGRDMAHQFSYAHPKYTPQETDRKFDSFLGNRKHVLCTTLRRHPAVAHLCQQCTYFNQVKSPAGIPKVRAANAAAAYVVPPATLMPAFTLPSSEYYNSTIGLMRRKRKKEEQDVVVWYGNNVCNVNLAESFELGGTLLTFDVMIPGKNTVRSVEVPTVHFTDTRVLRSFMGQRGHVFLDNNVTEVRNAMVAWLTAIRKSGSTGKTYSKLGWTDSDDPTVKEFVLGDTCYITNMTPTSFRPIDDLKPFVPRGTATHYDKLVNTVLYNERRPEVHTHIAASLAAPLMKLCPVDGGLVLNFHSTNSGVGKSTITQLAASLWGRPGAMIGGVEDTSNATMGRIGRVKNLPYFFDEPRVADTKKFLTQLLFRTNQGVDKQRYTSQMELRTAAQWSTLVILTSNAEISNTLHAQKSLGDAATARYLDIFYTDLTQAGVQNAGPIGRAKMDFDTCYGHVGHKFVQLLVDHHAKFPRVIDRMYQGLRQKANIDPRDNTARIQLYVAACIWFAAHLASTNGLLPLNEKMVAHAMYSALITADMRRREARKTLDPIDVLIQYLRTMEGSRLRTVNISGSGRAIDINHPHVKPPIAYEVRLNPNEILIDIIMLEDYLSEKGMNMHAIMKTLRQTYTASSRVLGVGTPHQGPAVPVLVLPDQAPWDSFFIS